MLQILRKKAQSPFIQAIVVIIALVFIFWGVGTNLGNKNQAAIVVNDEEISFTDFQKAYDRAYQQMAAQFGGNVPKGLAETLGLKQQVINQVVQTALLRQGAAAMGIVVSGEEIREIIEEMPQFQELGAFSIERYKTILAANKMAPAKFEQSIRLDHLSEAAVQRITGFSAVATDQEIAEIYSRRNEKVAVHYAKLSPADFLAQVSVDDAALASWFEGAKEKYKSEPRIRITYLSYTFSAVGDKVTIDQAKIEEYYQANLRGFQTPEQRHARHILFKVDEKAEPEVDKAQAAKAEEVAKQAKGGADFASLAKKHSEDASKDTGGDLGFFSKGQMVPAFDEAVFALKPGEVSEVVRSQFGYHIIKLEEIKPATTQSLAEAREQITATLRRKEAENLAFQLANEAYEKIITAGNLEKYREGNPEATLKTTEFFSKSKAPEELRDDPTFLDKLFELNKGELSSLIKGQSGYLIAFAEDRKEPEVPALDAVKKEASADFRKAKATELAETAAKEILGSVKGGKTFEEACKDKGLTIKESGLLAQFADKEVKSEFPTALLPSAFLLSSASPVPEAPGRSGEDFFVYAFAKREIPKMADDAEEKKLYRETLQRYKQQQLLAAWLRHMETEAKISKNQHL